MAPAYDGKSYGFLVDLIESGWITAQQGQQLIGNFTQSESSPNEDCENCKPTHPRRFHAGGGGICSIGLCTCIEFKSMPPATVGRCVLCGRYHTTGYCPFNHKNR